MPQFEVWKSEKDGQYYWHLKADGGEILAQGEGHRAQENAQIAVRGVKHAAANAEIPEDWARKADDPA